MAKITLKPIGLFVLPFLFSAALQAQIVTNTVGVVKHTLKGGKYNLLGLTLHNPVTIASKFTGTPSGTVLTDSAIDYSTTLTSGKTYVLEITSGTLAGTIQEITTWSGNTITTTANLPDDGLAVNDTYQMRECSTLQQIFGTNNEAGLQEGFSGTADLVWIPNAVGSFVKYYYHPGSTFPTTVGEGWKILGGGDAPTAVTICYADCVVVESRNTSDVTITLSGSVIMNSVTLAVTSDYNFVSGVFPVGSTLANSGLSTSMQHGFSGTADLLWIPNADASDYDKYYYHQGSTFPTTVIAGWKLLGGDVSVDKAAIELKNGMIIEKRAASPYNAKITPPSSYSN